MLEKFLHYFLASLLILVIFIIIHVMHFRFLKPEVVLKASIIDAILSCFIGFIIFGVILKYDLFVSFSAIITMFLGLAIYAILIPTMVDRSLSVYMLVYLDENSNGSLTKDELKKMLIKDVILEKRIEEHLRAGAIELDGTNVKITKKGRVVSKIFMYDMAILDLKRNF